MSMVKKSITVTEKQAEWVKSKINEGFYGNESEVFRDLIRKEQTRDHELVAIRQALVEGEQSGEPQPFDAARFKETMKIKHA
ncbi:MAG: type II toxin-antitoxin system ParD family antitoxin [Candidatus Hinthialibacter antarcticus]|nr:type II toxin-antitoxin system ParD family antitoxin [Candidatus Hinthialibacter antarcticus]